MFQNSLEDWLYQIRLSEYGMELYNQGYRSVADVATISIEDLEDVGLFKLGHQKRFLLAVKRIKELKSGRRVPAYPAAQPVPTPLPSNGSTFQPQQQQRQLPPAPPVRKLSVGDNNSLYSTFQRQNSSSGSAAFHVNVQQHSDPAAVGGGSSCQQSPSKGVSSSPKPIHYQPDIICIERRPSASTAAGSFCHEEEGSPPPPSPPAMPAPMAPLNPSWRSRSRQFQQQQTAQPHSDTFGSGGGGSMVRSFDDGDILHASNVHHHYASAGQQPRAAAAAAVAAAAAAHHSSLNGGGGTLPRALVKPRPIAKISAILNPQQPCQMSDHNDVGKKGFASSTDNLKQSSMVRLHSLLLL